MNIEHPDHGTGIEHAEKIAAVGFCVLVAVVTIAVVIANIHLFF